MLTFTSRDGRIGTLTAPPLNLLKNDDMLARGYATGGSRVPGAGVGDGDGGSDGGRGMVAT